VCVGTILFGKCLVTTDGNLSLSFSTILMRCHSNISMTYANVTFAQLLHIHVMTVYVFRQKRFERADRFAVVVGASKAKSFRRQTAGRPSPWQRAASAAAADVIAVVVFATQTCVAVVVVVGVQVSQTGRAASERERVRASVWSASFTAASAAGRLHSQVCRHSDVNELLVY